jgi:hypothetical protein
MNSSIANGGTLLNHLLAHHLAQNETIPLALPFVLGILTSSRAVQRCEVEEGIGGPIMKRFVNFYIIRPAAITLSSKVEIKKKLIDRRSDLVA